jgi:membrane protease YdiL (CAAX protease family)
VEVASSKTRGNTTVLMLCALVPAAIWASLMKIIGDMKGYHSGPGIWAALVGFPGVVASAWIYQWTKSEPPAYVAAFLVNWLFWFGLMKAVSAIRLRLSKPR